MSAIFINPSGQEDNLGDSVLRRKYLSVLRESGELHVLVRGSRDYEAGLGLSANDVVYRSARRWILMGLRSALEGRASFALNAGEIVLDRRYWFALCWQALLALSARASGGTFVAAGISMRVNPGRAVLGLTALLKSADMVLWRDPTGVRDTGIGSVVPDWAFAEQSEGRTLQRRSSIVVSMRGDRPAPPSEWLEAIRGQAVRNGWVIVVVVQVIRDSERAHEMAAKLQAEVLDWSGGSHREHEALVREAYASAVGVISDRIHCLILGACEGAIPIGCAPGSSEKIDRTFRAITRTPVSYTMDYFTNVPDSLERAVQKGQKVLEDVATARSVVESASFELGVTLAR
ncbi:polysaccharide pyruvyl transferase family protein [Rhodococcus wratislaviensis]|uniref:polysaccharide pyruvyl transferase family protein n=1 Tax=Rhodococcus wratislaviensis TaxID=44752 RepID=UPI0026CCCE2D